MRTQFETRIQLIHHIQILCQHLKFSLWYTLPCRLALFEMIFNVPRYPLHSDSNSILYVTATNHSSPQCIRKAFFQKLKSKKQIKIRIYIIALPSAVFQKHLINFHYYNQISYSCGIVPTSLSPLGQDEVHWQQNANDTWTPFCQDMGRKDMETQGQFFQQRV